MATRRRRTKLNIPMCLAGVLLCLTLISVHLTSGLYARYTTTAEGSDLARVAVFKVTEDRTTFSSGVVLGVAPGEKPTTAAIHVKNDSEVAIRYTITVTNETENLPLSFRVGDGTESAVTATGSWNMSVGSETDCVLRIYWKDVAGAEAYMGMVDKISITLTAEQID